MSWQDVLEAAVLVLLLAVTVPPLGRYIAAVYGSRADGSAPGDRVFGPLERGLYRICRVDARREQRWNVYAISLLAFSLVSMLFLYAMLRLQGSLPFNPTDRDGVSPTGAFNIAVSFVTNTNWQWYSGEVAMSHFTQMVGLAVQNFVSAGVGFAVIVAIIRGITRTRHRSRTLGNFWVDMIRGTVRILLPLSFIFALVLVSQGVVQNFSGGTTATVVDVASGTTEQLLPGGPAASQIAIKQIGTNGGGFFNANSAHPFENPNGLSNILEMWAILVIPFALVVACSAGMPLSRRASTGRRATAARSTRWRASAPPMPTWWPRSPATTRQGPSRRGHARRQLAGARSGDLPTRSAPRVDHRGRAPQVAGRGAPWRHGAARRRRGDGARDR
jgi:K+-transporting ATPase ATPase A chain